MALATIYLKKTFNSHVGIKQANVSRLFWGVRAKLCDFWILSKPDAETCNDTIPFCFKWNVTDHWCATNFERKKILTNFFVRRYAYLGAQGQESQLNLLWSLMDIKVRIHIKNSWSGSSNDIIFSTVAHFGSWVKEAPDPGYGSATLEGKKLFNPKNCF